MVAESGGLRASEWKGLTLLLLVAFSLRLVGLTTVPPGLRYDEVLNYRMAERVLAGERPVYFGESWGHEPLFHYVQAAAMALTRECDWSLRLPATTFGFLGVLTTWLVARRLFGVRIAALSAGALTVSFWSILYSRQGLRVIAVTPLCGLMVYFLWRGQRLLSSLEWQGALLFSLAGAFLGGALYTYMAARAMAILPLAFAVYLALFHQPTFRRSWSGFVILTVVAVVVAAPLFLYLCQNPQAEQRLNQLSAPLNALIQGRPIPVLHLAARALEMFVRRGQTDWLYNVHGRPIFDVLSAICFLLGAGTCVWRWRESACALVLLWLGIGLVPTVLATPAASLTHGVAAQAPAYIVMGLGLDVAWRTVQKWRSAMGPVLALGIIAVHGALSCYACFFVWPKALEVKELYQAGITAVARTLDAQDSPGAVAIGAPYVNYWHPWNAIAFDLSLRRKDLDVRWFNPAESVVWPVSSEPVTFYFPYNPLGPQSFAPELEKVFLSNASLVPRPGNDFVSFRVTDLTGLERRLASMHSMFLAWPPGVSNSRAPTLPVVFGDRFALTGAEMEQKAVASGAELRLITYWETMTADPTSVVAFAHLTSDGKDIWGQHDGLEVRCASLRPGDRFAQIHRIPVKAETPSGTYYIQIGLYAPDTLIRLPVTTARGSAMDRVWVQQVEVAKE